jgi:hypothetical protein
MMNLESVVDDTGILANHWQKAETQGLYTILLHGDSTKILYVIKKDPYMVLPCFTDEADAYGAAEIIDAKVSVEKFSLSQILGYKNTLGRFKLPMIGLCRFDRNHQRLEVMDELWSPKIVYH